MNWLKNHKSSHFMFLDIYAYNDICKSAFKTSALVSSLADKFKNVKSAEVAKHFGNFSPASFLPLSNSDNLVLIKNLMDSDPVNALTNSIRQK